MLELTELSFVAGPVSLPSPAYSFANDWEAPIFTPDEFAFALSAIDGVEITHPPEPDWNAWRATWNSGVDFITFELLACEMDPNDRMRPGLNEYWGGSPITAKCSLQQLMFVWNAIRLNCPGVCLHDTDCQMYSPETFHNFIDRD